MTATDGAGLSANATSRPVFPVAVATKSPSFTTPKIYKSRNLIERLFGRLKDWRRVAMRYDRCAHTFFSAICIAASVIFWL